MSRKKPLIKADRAQTNLGYGKNLEADVYYTTNADSVTCYNRKFFLTDDFQLTCCLGVVWREASMLLLYLYWWSAIVMVASI